jgi:hypothetical protein
MGKMPGDLKLFLLENFGISFICDLGLAICILSEE